MISVLVCVPHRAEDSLEQRRGTSFEWRGTGVDKVGVSPPTTGFRRLQPPKNFDSWFKVPKVSRDREWGGVSTSPTD